MFFPPLFMCIYIVHFLWDNFVTRGRDVSMGIHGFTVCCEFYSTKNKIYYRRREYIIEGEEKNKEKPITYKTLFM